MQIWLVCGPSLCCSSEHLDRLGCSRKIVGVELWGKRKSYIWYTCALNLGLDMFDQDELDRRKEEAKAKTKLPSLGSGGGSVAGQRLDDKTYWTYVIENFEPIQKVYGLSVEKGIWYLVDKGPGESMQEPHKSWFREFLNQKRLDGKFKIRGSNDEEKNSRENQTREDF